MTFMATSINQSPVYVDKAGVAIEDVRGRAVKFDENGCIALCGAGEVALGVGIMTNDKNIAAGEDVHIQIKDIGLVRTGAAIKKGAELAAGVDGKFVPAESGFVCAIALEAAEVADIYIKARLMTYKKGGPVINVADYEDLGAAIAAAEEGSTIKLAENTSLAATLAIDKSLIIDLNGKTLSGSDIWAKSGTLTIKNGTVETTGSTDAFVVGDYLGGKEKATGDTALVIEEGVTIRTESGCCVYVRASDHKATVTTAGNLTATSEDAAAIQGNGISKGDVMVIGGKIEAANGTAIYQPQDGYLTISGGEVSGKVGVEIRNGELTVTGGTINGSADAFGGIAANGNGTTVASGVAVAVSQHSTNKPINVRISGGALNGYYALYEEDVQDESTGEGIDIHITGGTFNGGIYSENVTGFISGGEFSNAVTAEQCAEGYTPTTEPVNGYYSVA